jgi:hypothetical protein
MRRVIGPVRDLQPIESTVSLNRGATTWVAKPHGRRVTCESGALWLCFDGEPENMSAWPKSTGLGTPVSRVNVVTTGGDVGPQQAPQMELRPPP